MRGFHPLGSFEPAEGYVLLPFSFEPLAGERYVAINMVGNWLVLARGDLKDFVDGKLLRGRVYRELKAKQFLKDSPGDCAETVLTLQERTRRAHVANFTGLHMLVVTLRCNHSCQYCQVSRKASDASRWDMSPETAERAVDFCFRSPNPAIKIEFQGGEPLLNWPIIQKIIERAEEVNRSAGKNICFVVASNLSLLTEEMLGFCEDRPVFFSTSLDGPADLHDKYRKFSAGSHEAAVRGIRMVQERLGRDRVSALMTTTRDSLHRGRDIVDEYMRRGLDGVFLRSLNPFGFAVSEGFSGGYSASEWFDFYRDTLAYILEINRGGHFFVEQFSGILLQRMLSPYGTGFVNLQSPAGIGIGGVVVNYDGSVYPSDEGRMRAEMGDQVFRMGNVCRDKYREIMMSEALLGPLEASVAECVPMCHECGFLPYCGADPDYHHATQKDFVGHKALSGFCQKHMAVFRWLLTLMVDDPAARQVFESWVKW